MTTTLHTEVTIKPNEALMVLEATDQLDNVQLLIDHANTNRAVLEIYVDGSSTAQTVLLKVDGTWEMKHNILIGQLP